MDIRCHGSPPGIWPFPASETPAIPAHRRRRAASRRAGLVRTFGVFVLCMAGLHALVGHGQLARAQEASAADSVGVAPEPGAKNGKLAISRKVLPDVQATTVPKAEAPRRPPRLDDPLEASYHFQEARLAAAGGQFDVAQVHMREALKADPSQPQFRWWFSGEVIKRCDPGAFIWSVPRTLQAAVADPLARRRLWVQIHQEVLLFVAIFWSVLVLIYLGTYWRYLSHDLTALIFRDSRHRLRLWAPWLFIAGALLVRPGWIGLLALLSVPLVVQARGRNRWALVGAWLLATFLLFPHWPALRDAAPALDPESETNLVARASRLPAHSPLMRTLEKRLDDAAEPDRRARLRLALAIQNARAGHYERSNGLLQQVLRDQANNVPAHVNLANNTYYLGKLDAAVTAYLAARKLAPERGEIPYNLAQVYFKKLFVPEASEALKDARALGFDPPPWEDLTGEANGYSPVVYLGPGAADLAASCRWEAPLYPPQVGLAAWNYFLGCPPLPLFLVLVSLLGLALALVRWWSNQGDPRGCDNCGAIVCRDCCEVRTSVWYCHACADTVDRARSEMVLATLLKNRSRTVGLERSARVTLMSRLLPGAGHLVIGDTARAVGRAALLALGLFGMLFAWSFDPAQLWATPGLVLAEETLHPVWWPLPAAAWQGWTYWPVVGGGLLIFLVYLTALLDGTQMRRRIPEHFLLAASEGEGAARTVRRAI